MSICAIYNAKAFLPSIGQTIVEDAEPTGDTGEDWPVGGEIITDDSEWADGAGDSRGLNWYKWDQETFKKAKRQLRSMFVSAWNYREPLDFNAELDFELSGRLRELMNFNFDGVSLNWFLRRRLIDRPFNKDNEECE